MQSTLANWFSDALAAAFEGLTGERPRVVWSANSSAPPDSEFGWRQTFSSIPGAIWIVASQATVNSAGACILAAAGVGESDPDKLKPEFLEIVRQSLAALAGSLSAHLAAEVRCEADREEKNWPGDAAWIAADVSLGESQMRFFAGFEPGLIAALQKQPEPAPSKTYDLLLDVELPVSVSFGRAQVPLKDVLKLTTGSIIELNRAIADPVEVIVNNCVIARGEVVTVDGNFGVRIQQVISRQERLRTLK